MGGSSHQASPNGAWKNSVAKLTNDMQDVHKEDRGVIMGEGQGLSAEDESRINEPKSGLNDCRIRAVTPSTLHSGLQQQHLPPTPVVQWEMILPVRTLKVLLVESDDSTRQVVSALLRNCSYEVTAADNGLQAWKILENPTNHIDLILTEVAMPGLNGINLLSKIMTSDTCKNIPVIMMSSNDSMGTVFKCLSRGAVDFLVKPIRKNELKNLWQHVWRRSHSSSGSVSESGIQTQKATKSKGVNDSDNNTSSNDEDDASIGLNTRNGSDNGSGTQSSWTKHAIEVDSPQPMSPPDQLTYPHDSTCAQVISDSEIFCNKWMPMTANRECQERKKHADELMGKDLEIGVPRNPVEEPESHPSVQVSTKPTGQITSNQSENDQKNGNVLLGLGSGSAFDEPSTKAVDLIGGIANNTDTPLANGVTEPGTNDKNSEGSMELPSLQLSLKRLRSSGEVGNAIHEDRNTLRHSDQSAFSRYRTSAASTQAPTGCVGSCSPVDNSLEAVKTESTQNMVSKDSNPGTAKQGSNDSSDNNDKGSTTNQIAYKEKAAASTVALKGIPPSAFHPVQVQSSPHQVTKATQEKIDDVESTALVKCQYQVQHHHHHYHHHHHHAQSMQQPLEHDDSSRKTMKAAAAQHCGSSNVFGGKTEGNAANYSLNGSNSGSNHRSSGANIASANGVAEKCGGGGRNGSGSGSGSGVDQNRITQREAALMKFREKRKERNFGKKVRYHGRKRLAEQRPRVRGQFVRQAIQEPKNRQGDS